MAEWGRVVTSSTPPRRKPSQVIAEQAERIWEAWGGPTMRQGLERLRTMLRARVAGVEAYLDEEATRREAFERDVRDRLVRLERVAHKPYDFSELVTRLETLERGAGRDQ